MKVKIPKQIKIGCYNYKVVYKAHLKADDGWLAACNQRLAEIQIDPATGDNKDRSFMHEIVHLVNFNYENAMEEHAISRMANGIMEFLDNLGIEFDWSEIDGME